MDELGKLIAGLKHVRTRIVIIKDVRWDEKVTRERIIRETMESASDTVAGITADSVNVEITIGD